MKENKTTNIKASLLSLSSGMAGDKDFLKRYLQGVKYLKKIGIEGIPGKYSLKGSSFISHNPNKRAQDLMDAFKNTDIDLIISNIGGNDCHKVIPFLNINEIILHNKPLMGFSDTTSILLYLAAHNVNGYYGPSVLDGFAENGGMHALTEKSFKDTVLSSERTKIKSSSKWTSEFLEWSNPSFLKQKRKMKDEKYGHLWVNFNQDISGLLAGGCLETISQIKDHEFFPDLTFWKDKIIFLETSELGTSPEEFRECLKQIGDMIEVSSAILFGKPKDEKYFHEFLKIIKEEINKPVIYNLNFGHTAPFYVLPYNGECKLSWKNKTITLMEHSK